MKINRMGIKDILRRIWLFSANKIKIFESVSKQPTQLIKVAHNCQPRIVSTPSSSELNLYCHKKSEREETKTRYFAPWRFNRWRKHVRKPTRAVGANQIGQNSLYLWEEQVEKRYSFSLRSTQPINN